VDVNFGLGEATSALMILFLIIVSVIYMGVHHVSATGFAPSSTPLYV
jgi:hypothetical protein